MMVEGINGAQIVRVPTPKPYVSFKEKILQELLLRGE